MAERITALFVDDDSTVLSGMKRVLRSIRSEVAADFASSGTDALARMAAQDYDVIVTDIRMPGMSGIELLRIVAAQYPDTARLVLSEHADRSDMVEAAGLAHQYLVKPCDADSLRATMLRSTDLRVLLADPELRRLAGGARALPSVPELYHRINTELASEEPSMTEIASIIGRDPAMSLKILQLVNSSFFGLRREIADVSEAVTLLGLDTISSLVLGVGVFQSIPRNDAIASLVDQVYETSVAVAGLAKSIAKVAGAGRQAAEEAYQAGLLHDIGALALASNWPTRWRQVDTSSMALSERVIFGTTHASFGAYLASLWGLPDSIVEAIHHHTDQTAITAEFGFTPLVGVRIARALLHADFDRSILGNARQVIIELGIDAQIDVWRDQATAIPEAV